MTSQIAVRLPDDQLAALDALVPKRHGTRSEAVRRAVELYIYRVACEQDAAAYDATPLTDIELALTDDAEAWAGTPAW